MIACVKPYYKNTVAKVSENLKRYDDCFRFAVVADTHLDNSIPDTLANINAVDQLTDFKCLVHLGDFMNGNLPRNYTKEILKNEMERFRNSIKSKAFYPVQGNHDGFLDVNKYNTTDMAIDEDWYDVTGFLSEYGNVVREKNAPYFYVDFPDDKIRFIILCTFYYKGFYNNESFTKMYGTKKEQVDWFQNSALDVGEGWTVMAFSHDTPFSDFGENVCEDNQRINGNLMMEVLKAAIEKNKFDFAGWFIGHFHGDFIGKINGLNFILTASETAYVPQLFGMPVGAYPPRTLNTETEDAWDGVVIDKKNRRLRIFRFGSGNDREIEY